jgi:hypothetical protein
LGGGLQLSVGLNFGFCQSSLKPRYRFFLKASDYAKHLPSSELIFTYSNIHPTRCNVTQFILSGNCSTCFGSQAKTTVSTASVFVTPLLLSAAIVEELQLLCSSNSSTIAAGSSNGVTNTDAVDTVVFAPDDG